MAMASMVNDNELDSRELSVLAWPGIITPRYEGYEGSRPRPRRLYQASLQQGVAALFALGHLDLDHLE